MEGAHRTWRADCEHAASVNVWQTPLGPRLLIRPQRAGSLPDWRTVGSRPREADKLAGEAEASDVFDSGGERGGGDDADAGDTHEAAHVGRVAGADRDRSVEGVDFAHEEVNLPQPAVHRVALVTGKLELGEPLAAGFAEQVAHRRLRLRLRIRTAWISFLDRVRERTSGARR